MPEPVALLIGAALCLSALFFGLFALALVARRRPRRQQQAPAAPVSAGARPPAADHVRPARADLPYIRNPALLTAAEHDFFTVLQKAVPPGWYVFPQVRLANLVLLRKGTRNWKPHFSRVAQKCVDFVLCDAADISPQLVVELDDSSHNRPDRQERDAFVDAALASAGLPILHVPWQRRYDATQLATDIRRAAGLSAAPAPLFAPAPPALAASPPMRDAPAVPLSPAMIIPMPPRMVCRRCNAEVGMSAKFCSGCGATLEL